MRSETTEHPAGGAWTRIRLAVCALLLIGAAALAQPASPAVARPALGVATLDFPSSAEIQRMARGGVQTYKLSIFWQKVQPTATSPPDWSSYDAQFAAAATAGIRILPLLHGSAPWVNSNFQRPPLDAGWKRAAWRSFVGEFAARYGHNGLFWKMHPLLPYVPPDYWEVWNEPNLRYFWGGKPSPRRYATLLRITSGALHASDPGAVVMVGGLFEHARQGFGLPASRFLADLYRRHGIRRYFDAVALHPYATKPRGVLQNVKFARNLMNRHHDANTPIVITELGWTVGGLGWSRSPFRATPAQQANRLSNVFGLLTSRPRLRLGAILWFSWRDGPENLWIFRMGLFDRSGQPRPAWFAYARAAGGTP